MENIIQTAEKKLSNGAKIFLVYLISILGGIVLVSPLSKIYIYIFKPNPLIGFGDIGSTEINYLSGGFTIGYIFFLSLLVVLLEKRKHQFWTWFWGIILFLVITLGEWKYFGFNLLVSLVGYIVGFGVLYIKNRVVAARRAS